MLLLLTCLRPPPAPFPPPLLVKTSVSIAEQEMWKKSFSFFEKGMKDFEAIEDSTNTALLLCNTGRLMRICAQAHCAVSADQSRGEFSPEEALYYNKVRFQTLYVSLKKLFFATCPLRLHTSTLFWCASHYVFIHPRPSTTTREL